jgi:uridine kinase
LRIYAISGSSGVGKTTLANNVKEEMNHISIIGLDSFMLNRKQRDDCGLHHGYTANAYNIELMLETLDKLLLSHNPVEVFEYDHSRGVHYDESHTLKPTDIMILDSAMALSDFLVERYDMDKVFMDVPDKLLIPVKIATDISRNYPKDNLIRDAKVYKQGYLNHCKPQIKNADIIITLNKIKNRQYDITNINIGLDDVTNLMVDICNGGNNNARY